MEGEDADVVQSPDQISVISAPVAKPDEPKPEEIIAEEPEKKQEVQQDLGYCFALYDYDAEGEDELNLEEGQVRDHICSFYRSCVTKTHMRTQCLIYYFTLRQSLQPKGTH